uniref:Peptidase_M16_C domain-containing protein n=1 Tax=Angiostrongylus cantonensis TaxID=6313 RepID=A0A0K0DP47_ANGCA
MFMSGYAHINGTFRDSELVNVWMEPEVVDKAYHNGTNFGYGNDSVKSRQFRLPPLFFRIAVETPDYEKMLADWNKRFPYINTSNLSVADTIVITENEAERAAEVFATNNVRRRSIEDNLFHYYLGDAAVPGAVLELVFPKPEASHTLSFLSAFIIKVVYASLEGTKEYNFFRTAFAILAVFTNRVSLGKPFDINGKEGDEEFCRNRRVDICWK